MGRQRLWPLNPPTKMTQAMMTGNDEHHDNDQDDSDADQGDSGNDDNEDVDLFMVKLICIIFT